MVTQYSPGVDDYGRLRSKTRRVGYISQVVPPTPTRPVPQLGGLLTVFDRNTGVRVGGMLASASPALRGRLLIRGLTIRNPVALQGKLAVSPFVRFSGALTAPVVYPAGSAGIASQPARLTGILHASNPVLMRLYGVASTRQVYLTGTLGVVNPAYLVGSLSARVTVSGDLSNTPPAPVNLLGHLMAPPVSMQANLLDPRAGRLGGALTVSYHTELVGELNATASVAGDLSVT